jgi:small-conductance mechanosensitive channel
LILPLAVLSGLGSFALLVVAVLWAQRRWFLVRQLAFPLYVGAAAAAIEVFRRFDTTWSVQARSALSWALLFLGLVFVLKLLGLYVFDVHLIARRGLRLPPLLPAVAMFVVYLVVALASLRWTFPGFDVRPLLATSAVTSLVLGLALQPILGNFFAGLVISLEKPFRLNDWIKVGEHEGRVVAITWRTTHLRTRENNFLVIPNSKISDERVLNFYYPQPLHLERLRVGVSYQTPPYRVKRALLDCTVGVPGVLEKPSPEVYLASFDDSAVTYELRTWIEDVVQGPRIASDLRSRVWEELRRQGITIPYPTRTLELSPRRPHPAPRPAGEPIPARLYVTEGTETGTALALDGTEGATLGRSRGCSLVLSDGNASKEHCRIEWTAAGYRLSDLGSSFGTRVNGQRVSEVLLQPFDRIGIGETVLVFERDDA